MPAFRKILYPTDFSVNEGLNQNVSFVASDAACGRVASTTNWIAVQTS